MQGGLVKGNTRYCFSGHAPSATMQHAGIRRPGYILAYLKQDGPYCCICAHRLANVLSLGLGVRLGEIEHGNARCV